MALTVQSSLGHVSSTVLDPSNRWYACSSGRIPPKKSCMVYASTQIGGNHGWNSWNSSHRGPSELSWRLSFESDEWDSVLSKKRHKWAVHNMTPGRAKAKHEAEPLKVMIAGAPASGKGTQCELISKKYGLTHIATGDLLRAEVAAGTEYGKKAKEYMDQGKLVPDEVVVTMVTQKLAQSHAKKKGWLLDGYPRSLSQAEALQALGIKPSIFILLEVPEDILIDRVVGRRIDPITGKIYHLTYSPPKTPEIASRLIQRSDDTVDRVHLRLQMHAKNMEPVLSVYKDFIKKVDGDADKDAVFAEIIKILEDPEIFLPGVNAVVASSGN
ncbi:hypothetical protein O6H91_09G092600 [Diphasiastrum complanatum]|uniref:Uncharacterized protein n=1 Tax=Diphasiastrum complanatum TaxID=34168 RepID=A0ACC2CSZ9_DIPCM|nr:hypothetical protein O6H91_09G092600 [Diphasiastrum complanatum]